MKRRTHKRTMAELRWIQTSLIVMLLLQVTAVTERLSYSSIAVRAGDDVTLSCTYVIDVQHECNRTNWIFDISKTTRLVRRGKIVEEDNPISDRLSVTENCSLVLKKVSAGDAGRFECQQVKSGQLYHVTVVSLSIVTTPSDCSAVTFIMLLMRVAELLLLTVITVLLIRAAVNQRAPERSPAVRR